MVSSGTRKPSPMSSTDGGATWSYSPPHSSQVTKIAVSFHMSLFITPSTMSLIQLCAHAELYGGWSESWNLGVTQLTEGSVPASMSSSRWSTDRMCASQYAWSWNTSWIPLYAFQKYPGCPGVAA